MLVSMSNVLQKKHENFRTAKKIMTNLEDFLGGQVALVRQSAITNLMNSQQKPSTPIKEHMLKLASLKLHPNPSTFCAFKDSPKLNLAGLKHSNLPHAWPAKGGLFGC